MKLTPLTLPDMPKQKTLTPTPVTFAGEGAETADMSTLAKAREMYAEESVKEVPNFKRIWKETGWFKNPLDNKWRYEISDKGATFVDGKFSHPELEKAYPNIFKDYTFKVEKYDEGNLRGYHDSNEKVISVSANSSPEEQLSTMVHEFQHAIQTKEEMTIGGSPRSLESVYTRASRNPEWVKAVEDTASIARRKEEFWKTKPKWNPPDITDPEWSEYYKEYDSKSKVFDTEWHNLNKEWEEGYQRVSDIETDIERDPSSDRLFDTYQRFGGEAEARAVQLRLNGELDNVYPLLTYDTPAYKQVDPKEALRLKNSMWMERK